MSGRARRPEDGAELVQTAPGAPLDLSPGSIVGEYRIDSVLGRGGMGTVYAAVQPLIEKKVAIKVLSRHLSASPDAVRRFIDEARAVNRIGHENIIDIFSFGQLPDGQHYFVMEYLDGATLADRLSGGDLAPEDLASVLSQICDALEAAHAHKIVHRDLKLENIWIAGAPPGRVSVRLLDFGIAKLLAADERTITETGALVGTPQYMSPEQCHGRDVDHRSDIYAMGVILYRVYTGRMPIRGATYPEIIAKQLAELPPRASAIAPLSPALDRLIMSCLDKDPALRPQSARELATALAAALSGAHALAGVAGAADDSRTSVAPPVKTARARRLAVFAGVAALAASLAIVGWLMLRTTAHPLTEQRRAAADMKAPSPASNVAVISGAPPLTAVAPPIPARAVDPPAGMNESSPPTAADHAPAKTARRRNSAASATPASAAPASAAPAPAAPAPEPPPPAATSAVPEQVNAPAVPKKDYGF